MPSNCIIVALAIFWRRWKRTRWVKVDGERYFVAWLSGPCRILIRPSRLGGWVPHVLYAELRRGTLRIVHFVPADKRPKVLPPPLFSGEIKRGDFAPTIAEPPRYP